MLDGAVFAGRVHGLEDQQQAVAVSGMEQALLQREFGDLLFDQLAVALA
jgi:hypothetical protein